MSFTLLAAQKLLMKKAASVGLVVGIRGNLDKYLLIKNSHSSNTGKIKEHNPRK